VRAIQTDIGLRSDAIAQRLAGHDSTLLARIKVGAGIEVRSSGDLRLADDFNLGFSPAGSHHDASTLSLRAAGNLTLGYSLSSGFSALTSAAAITGAGASFRLVAGADLSAADPDATRADATTTTLTLGRAATTAGATAPTVLLRSTTGELSLASGGDLTLLNSAVRVYTTGTPVDTATLDGWSRVNFSANQGLNVSGSLVGPFFDDAGDIRLQARGTLRGSPNRQYVTDWWWRQTSLGSTGTPVAWWSRYDLFQQGVASFGGGSITAQAGGDIVDLELSTPSAGYSVQAVSAQALAAQGRTYTGGTLEVRAGGDIVSGLYNAGGPTALLQAAGDIRPAQTTGLGLSHPGTQIFYGDTRWQLLAGGDLTLGQVTQPAMLSGIVQVNGSARSDVIVGLDNGAALTAISLAGDLLWAGTRTALSPSSDPRNTLSDAARLVPGSLLLAAPTGDLTVNAALLQRPVEDGSLALLADGSVSTQRVTVAAASPATSPMPLARSAANLSISRDWNRTTASVAGLDVSERSAVRLTAREGHVTLADDLSSVRPLRISAGVDISGTGSAALALQHQAEGEISVLRAGRDLLLADNASAGLRLAGPGDLLILAGRHVDLQGSAGIVTIGNQDNPRLLPTGGANVTIVAGVDWGAADYAQAIAQGVQLQGGGLALAPFSDRLYASGASQRQGTLAAAGVSALDAATWAALDARLQLDEALALADPAAWRTGVTQSLARLGVDAGTDAVATWRALPTATRAAAAAELAATLPAWQTVAAALARRQTGQPTLDDRAALAQWADFDATRQQQLQPNLLLSLLTAQTDAAGLATQSQAWLAGLPAERQALLLHDTLFDELRAAGRTAARLPQGAGRDAAYAPAYALLAQLYPGSRPAGDIRLSTSQIKSQQQGAIRLLAPGGGLDAGALNGSSDKKASQLGILTVAGGDIDVAVREDIAVNQSRIFTLARGDLLLWSSEGSIDAGRGARTVTGAPAPVTRIDANGQVVVDTSGSFSGSGIAVLDAQSVLDLYAPQGEISAGEAGIKPRGLSYIGAPVFIGKVEGSGNAVGAPPAPPAGGETAGLAAVAAAAPAPAAAAGAPAAGTDETGRPQRRRRALLLEFLGFGEDAAAAVPAAPSGTTAPAPSAAAPTTEPPAEALADGRTDRRTDRRNRPDTAVARDVSHVSLNAPTR
jgi:hypothetical protein